MERKRKVKVIPFLRWFKNRKSPIPCSFHLVGKCKHGAGNCNFTHYEIHQIPECKFGELCPFGEKCVFVHFEVYDCDGDDVIEDENPDDVILIDTISKQKDDDQKMVDTEGKTNHAQPQKSSLVLAEGNMQGQDVRNIIENFKKEKSSLFSSVSSVAQKEDSGKKNEDDGCENASQDVKQRKITHCEFCGHKLEETPDQIVGGLPAFKCPRCLCINETSKSAVDRRNWEEKGKKNK
mmetsp:Transcript_7734/g.10093  ORF Transcript_7734/g.10093 Transcript_7734/m.10093 type:complete len:236 (+) Transcript_7734:476-1183(+)